MTININCIIIEDEKPASDILELYISNVEILHLKGIFSSATQALNFLNTEKVDLIFLDVNLPGISGINFIKSLNPAPAVIFTTAYAEYAVESFELEAIDYLLKPIPFERFIKGVNRFLKLKKFETGIINIDKTSNDKSFVFIKCDKKMVKIFLDEILYFEAQKNYLLIYTESCVYRTYHSISEMEEKIPEQMFIRIHRSFVVALKKIEGYTANYVEIRKNKIPIGRYYSLVTSDALKSFLQIKH